MSQSVITVLLLIALVLPFVGALVLRMFARFLPSSATTLVAAIIAIVIVSAVLGLASIKIGSLRIGNVTLLLPVASVNRPVDVSSDILELDVEIQGSPTPYPEVTITPIPTMTATPTLEPTMTPMVEPTTELSEGEIISDTEVISGEVVLNEDGTVASGEEDTTASESTSTDGETAAVEPTTAPANTNEQLILVPTVAADLTLYYVKAGETLGQIAARFGVTTEQIEEANPMLQNPNNLVVGQEIYIP